MKEQVPVENLNEGIIISEPVLNSMGQVLIPAGTALTSRHITILKTWNITKVNIKGVGDDNTENEISEELRAMAIERLAKRMKWKPRNPNEEDLYEMGIIRAAELISKKTAGL